MNTPAKLVLTAGGIFLGLSLTAEIIGHLRKQRSWQAAKLLAIQSGKPLLNAG